jgi:amino acid transporter
MQECSGGSPASSDEYDDHWIRHIVRLRSRNAVLYHRSRGRRGDGDRVRFSNSYIEELPNFRFYSVPVFEMWRQATSSDAAATSFTIFLLVIVFTALNATHHTASRLAWSFARDNALVGSRWLNQMSPKQHVPIPALVFNFAIMFVIGCIYLASTSAFNAFIGTGLILQHITYAIPAALLMFRKRSSVWLPKNRYFRMPEVLGWAANLTTVGVAIFVLVFYTFPVAKPVTGGNMSQLNEPFTVDERLMRRFRLRCCCHRSDGSIYGCELGLMC